VRFSQNPVGSLYPRFHFLRQPAGHPECGELGMSALMRFWRDEAATTAIEYSLIAAGISVVIVAAVNAIGGDVKGLFTNVSSNLSNAGH
jgi:pilus assembly protein Flp/PilA